MNILLLGAPGSGKGSQAEQILKNFDFVQISTGDLLRDALTRKTSDGLLAGEFMRKGDLVPDELVLKILRERLQKPDCSSGVIFDGFPRNVNQAEKLDNILSAEGKKLDLVINIESPFEVLIARLLSRRVCSKCGKGFNMISNPPPEGICTSCGGTVITREDDKEEVIKNRLEVYTSSTKPLRDYYDSRGVLFNIDGNRTIPDIYEDVRNLITRTGKI
jgi:adenylate kinase